MREHRHRAGCMGAGGRASGSPPQDTLGPPVLRLTRFRFGSAGERGRSAGGARRAGGAVQQRAPGHDVYAEGVGTRAKLVQAWAELLEGALRDAPCVRLIMCAPGEVHCARTIQHVHGQVHD